MNTSEKSFNQAWEKLTTEGEMCSEKVSQDFTPIGIRKNVQEEGPLYHGTKADLKIGDYLKTGYPSNYGARKIASPISFRAARILIPNLPKSSTGIIIHLNNILSFRLRLWNDLIILINKHDCSGCGPDLICESLLNK